MTSARPPASARALSQPHPYEAINIIQGFDVAGMVGMVGMAGRPGHASYGRQSRPVHFASIWPSTYAAGSIEQSTCRVTGRASLTVLQSNLGTSS